MDRYSLDLTSELAPDQQQMGQVEEKQERTLNDNADSVTAPAGIGFSFGKSHPAASQYITDIQSGIDQQYFGQLVTFTLNDFVSHWVW